MSKQRERKTGGLTKEELAKLAEQAKIKTLERLAKLYPDSHTPPKKQG